MTRTTDAKPDQAARRSRSVRTKQDAPKIKYVSWRNGQPRFEPSPTLRSLGYTGLDLKDENDNWMTAGQALDWSRTFSSALKAARRTAAPKPKALLPVKRAPEPPPAAYPLSRLFDDWLSERINPDIADLRRNTVYEYGLKRNVLQLHAHEVWTAEAAALTKVICKGLYTKLRRAVGLAQAVATIRVLGIALQWGIDSGALPTLQVNPAHKLKMRKPEPRVRFGSPAEIDHMVATADRMGRPEIGDMIILAVWSGQRQSDRREFVMAGRADGRITLKQRKTGVIVSVKEAPELTARLEASARRRALALASLDSVVDLKEARQRRAMMQEVMDRVILDERHWRPFLKRHYADIYSDVRAAAAVDMPSVADLTDQDLRDTAVTWLATAEATIPEICSITGHTFGSANEILKHYLSLHTELADSGMAKMVVWHTKKQAKKLAEE